MNICGLSHQVMSKLFYVSESEITLYFSLENLLDLVSITVDTDVTSLATRNS